MDITEALADGEADKDAAHTSGLDFFVVGIGASAGGLAAIKSLLEGLPATPDMAFVVVLHLSPTHESSASAIFQNSTHMPVTQVQGRMAIERNHVYVIPPGNDLEMFDGMLQLVPSKRQRGRHVVIDHFFRTLAETHRTRAVGIVLSGTGSDGSVGIAALKEKGGIVLAQTPEDAEHDGMPASAIATRKVDLVLPAADMANQLVELWQNAARIEVPDRVKADQAANDARAPDEAEDALKRIMALLQQRTGHDFRHYKRATVLRRIERRMQVSRTPTLAAYRRYLQEVSGEAKKLLGDMLIGVTQFFRDRPAFDALEREVLPKIFENLDEDRSIRVWVPACSTGEEAYSVAMLVADEAARHREATKFTLFASDIDAEAVAFGRNGLYSLGIEADVPPTRLRAHFSLERDGYRISKTLREHMIFAEHNVLRDPPFSRVQLVSCRNLLIYLDRAAQQEALESFHFAMRPGGYLFLGSSETVDATSRLFTQVDKARRIYRANPVARPNRPLEPRPPNSGPAIALPRLQESAAARPPTPADIHRQLMEQFAPPTVLATESGEIVHVSPRASRYLRYAAGEPSHAIVQAVPGDLRQALRTALAQVNQIEDPVDAETVRTMIDGRPVQVRMTVQPVRHPAWPSPMRLISFDESDAVDDDRAARTADPAFAQLEDELQRRNEQVRSTIEQYEASSEELKASNEELQAINEELRSATEELETSKEELQSTNEELITVNEELKAKIEETSEINDDLSNLIASSNIATVFVDPDMRIKRFTPAAAQIFNLIESDVGRSLFDITHRLDYESLAEDARAVFTTLKTIEREIDIDDGRRLLARLLPYRTVENRISGAVLNFIDVTTLRRTESQMDVDRERSQLVAETMTDFAILTLDPEGRITSWNPGARNVFGYSPEEAIGQHFSLLFTEADRAAGIPEEELKTARERGRAPDERWMRRKDGSPFFASGVSAPLRAGQAQGYAKICRDMTGLRRVEELHEQALITAQMSEALAVAESEKKNEFLAVMSHELKHPLNLISVNAQLLTTLPEAQGLPSVMRAARTIQRTVISQGRIIDDLLDMSRLNTGKLTVNRVPLLLGEAIQPAVNWAVAEARQRNVRLLVEGLDEPLLIDGDGTRLEQIAWNLLSNAIKFSPPGGTIQVHLAAKGDEAMLCVSDSGRGIDAEFLPHVFQLFKQADSTTRRNEGGLGIGLAMVKSLSELHGGRVEAESDGRGAGATFRVFLPLHQSSDFAPLDPSRAMSPEELAGLRILLVDDTDDALETLSYLLEHAGFVVTSANSAKAALEHAGKESFDLLISDVGMPHMDGYQLVEELRNRPETVTLPAIALTGHGRSEDVQRAFAAGFHAHVDKPVDTAHLKRVIGAVVGAAREGVAVGK